MNKQPSPEIVKFIEAEILPLYERDLPYKYGHVQYVMRRSVAFANQDETADVNIAYVAAAYHDLGEVIDRDTHHTIGGQILRDDTRLREFFTPEQITDIAMAVEDHRASGKSEPRTIYGRIVGTADRHTNVDAVLDTTVNFPSLQHLPLDELLTNGYEHLQQKYGVGGYAVDKCYFDDPEFKKFVADLQELLSDETKFRRRLLDKKK